MKTVSHTLLFFGTASPVFLKTCSGWNTSHQPNRRHDSSTTCWTTAGTPRRSLGASRQEQVPFFGKVYRLGGSDEETAVRSFVDQMGVPTFVTVDSPSVLQASSLTVGRILPSIQPGPALVIENLLSAQNCWDLITSCEKLGFGEYQAGKNHHGALQVIVSDALVETLAQRIERHVNVTEVEMLRDDMDRALGKEVTTQPLQFMGINRRWRIYRYSTEGVQSFAPHIDAGFSPSGLTSDGNDIDWDVSNGKVVSRLTLLLYLNCDFKGGETLFYTPATEALGLVEAVKPITGGALLFPQAVGEDAVEYARQHWSLHEGSPVSVDSVQPKYVIRSDVLFADAES